MSKQTALVIDDERDIRELLTITLGRMNLFALAFRTNHMKTPAGRASKIADLVAMLERGQTIVPERSRRSRQT